jgi:hypothetical protein
MKLQSEMNPMATLPAAKALTIFCGVCEYDGNSLESLKSGNNPHFANWKFHINPNRDPEEKILNVLGDSYYESLVSSIFPGYTKTGKRYFNSHFAGQTHRFSHKIDLRQPVSVRKNDETIEKDVFIEYFDLFIFPGNIAIYSFRCDFSGCSYDEITLLVNYIRNKAPQEFSFISAHTVPLKASGGDSGGGLIFGNKLKSFTLVEMGQELTEIDEKDLLYDLATCSPVGSASGKVSYFQPTPYYKEKLWEENTVNVFDNWKGMCLFDSFTGLFRKGALNEFVWENAYFNMIFLHSLYVKHYLFTINRRFFLENTDKQELEDEFYEFDNYFNFRQISYNFLPQIIYEKTRHGFDIEDELAQMQTGIERANAVEQGIQDRRINKVLTIIAFLTVFSVILDASDLIDKLIFESSLAYQFISGSLALSVIVLISVLIFRNTRKKKKN